MIIVYRRREGREEEGKGGGGGKKGRWKMEEELAGWMSIGDAMVW